MREITFKAWIESLKKMTWNFSIGDTKLIINTEEGFCEHIPMGDVIFEKLQFTGIKDKSEHQKRIYEGDIVHLWTEDEYIPNRDSGGGIVDYDIKYGFSQIGVVGFTGCSFDYKTYKTIKGEHQDIHAPLDWLDKFEVIGNIYENPELLEN